MAEMRTERRRTNAPGNLPGVALLPPKTLCLALFAVLLATVVAFTIRFQGDVGKAEAVVAPGQTRGALAPDSGRGLASLATARGP
jgi:hypothetical protein